MPDPIAQGRELIDAAGWSTGEDALSMRERALWIECLCGCGTNEALSGVIPFWADKLGEYIAWAANTAPVLLDELAVARARIDELEAAHAGTLAKGRRMLRPIRDEHLDAIANEAPGVLARRLHTTRAVALFLRWCAQNAPELVADQPEAPPHGDGTAAEA